MRKRRRPRGGVDRSYDEREVLPRGWCMALADVIQFLNDLTMRPSCAAAAASRSDIFMYEKLVKTLTTNRALGNFYIVHSWGS